MRYCNFFCARFSDRRILAAILSGLDRSFLNSATSTSAREIDDLMALSLIVMDACHYSSQQDLFITVQKAHFLQHGMEPTSERAGIFGRELCVWDVLMACWLVLTLGAALRSTLHGCESLYVGKFHRSAQLEK
jgi:hypothetical protein